MKSDDRPRPDRTGGPAVRSARGRLRALHRAVIAAASGIVGSGRPWWRWRWSSWPSPPRPARSGSCVTDPSPANRVTPPAVLRGTVAIARGGDTNGRRSGGSAGLRGARGRTGHRAHPDVTRQQRARRVVTRRVGTDRPAQFPAEPGPRPVPRSAGRITRGPPHERSRLRRRGALLSRRLADRVREERWNRRHERRRQPRPGVDTAGRLRHVVFVLVVAGRHADRLCRRSDEHLHV